MRRSPSSKGSCISCCCLAFVDTSELANAVTNNHRRPMGSELLSSRAPGSRKRRQAALRFLTSISLDGKPPPSPAAQTPQTLPRSAEARDSHLEWKGDVQGERGDAEAVPDVDRTLLFPLQWTRTTLPHSPSRASAPKGSPSEAFDFPRLSLSSRRRLLSRSSVDTLEGIEENAPLRRCRTLSCTPRPKTFKKVHFINNIRQHDVRNGRIVLVSNKHSLCTIFSILPYRATSHVGELKLDSVRQRHHSGGHSMSTDMVVGLEGVELGADGKSISYAKLLYPTHALLRVGLLAREDSVFEQSPTVVWPASLDTFAGKSIPASLCINTECSGAVRPFSTSDSMEVFDYNPELLDDPQWPCGKHKRVHLFPSFMTTIIAYVKPSDLKKDMNGTFKEKFPHIKLTLSKIRSLKQDMCKLAQGEDSLGEAPLAMALVYFEKLVLQGKLNKYNRKLCAGACLLLAAKLASDLRRHEVKLLIDKVEERLKLNRRHLIAYEFPVLVALEFTLHLPANEVLPHYRRLFSRS
uniref:CDK5 and ABL1 enzyme substrate 1-like isoform X2 n=1 Tax=Myxine glutinosa TaxID=7769 RepID=UPI00358ECD7D